MSHGFSGPPLLADPQISDLEAWGSFLLPDEPSNLMSDPQQNGQQQADTSAVPVPHTGDLPNNSLQELSPRAQFFSKQQKELDLFLLSSSAI